jgi:hypothetical protein
MKKLLLTSFCLLSVSFTNAQTPAFCDSAYQWFNEIKHATSEGQYLWRYNLYGPMLLVNPDTRQLFANEQDSAGLLKKTGSIYTGLLPSEKNIANTAIDWSGKKWAMIILPLPLDFHERINLMAHELFHKSQSSLQFHLGEVTNNHLDEMNGRIYLQLELAALMKALESSPADKKQYIAAALTFRAYRYSLYPGADSTENELEINEGLAEYTGLMTSARNRQETLVHFQQDIAILLQAASFVRSFALRTIPLYGYLLHDSLPLWNQEITSHTSLNAYFKKAFNISLPDNIKAQTAILAQQYNGQAIIVAETAREAIKQQQLAAYKQLFIQQPHLDIALEKMNCSFNPGKIIPLEDIGAVYLTMRVTDNWGVLTVEKGALLHNSWKKITLSTPQATQGNTVEGDGWKLLLKEGYKIKKDKTGGNYILVKQAG